MNAGKIKKLKQYGNIRLFWEISRVSRKISFFYKKGKSDLLLSLAQPKRANPQRRQLDKQKIMSYVNLYSWLRGKLGIKDTCFTHSVLLCHMLRKNGFEAKIHFGARKADEPMENKIPIEGHCWVSIEGQHEVKNFKEVCIYP